MAQRAREGCKSLDRFVVRCVPARYVRTRLLASVCARFNLGVQVGCASVPPN